MITAVVLLRILIVVVAGVMSALSFAAGRRAGQREGQVKTLDQLRTDLDTTIREWNERATAGELARSVELPGIHAVRKMLGYSITLQPGESAKLRILL